MCSDLPATSRVSNIIVESFQIINADVSGRTYAKEEAYLHAKERGDFPGQEGLGNV